MMSPGTSTGTARANIARAEQSEVVEIRVTGQELDAQELLKLGLVNEVLPQDQVLDRAYVLARQILKASRFHGFGRAKMVQKRAFPYDADAGNLLQTRTADGLYALGAVGADSKTVCFVT